MSVSDRHVPVGTVLNVATDRPATILRDFEWLEVPAVSLDLEGIADLRAALDAGEQEVRAHLARVAEETADGEAAALLAASIDSGTPLVVEDDSPFADRHHDPDAAWAAGDDWAYGDRRVGEG